MKVLVVLIAFACAVIIRAEDAPAESFIPEDIIKMLFDLIKTIDFDQVWELVKMLLCGEQGLELEMRSEGTHIKLLNS